MMLILAVHLTTKKPILLGGFFFWIVQVVARAKIFSWWMSIPWRTNIRRPRIHTGE
jgi:hypothetical protein